MRGCCELLKNKLDVWLNLSICRVSRNMDTSPIRQVFKFAQRLARVMPRVIIRVIISSQHCNPIPTAAI